VEDSRICRLFSGRFGATPAFDGDRTHSAPHYSTHKDATSIIESIGNQGSSTNIGSAAFEPPYTYQAIPAADAPAIVGAGAGPK